MRKVIASIGMLSMLLVPTIAASAAAKKMQVKFEKKSLTTEYVGDFTWNNSPLSPQDVVLHIDKVFDRGNGVILFKGTHTYDGYLAVKIAGRIHARTRRVTIFENTKPTSEFVNDGSFQGTITADGKTMDLTWTTQSTGKQGHIMFKAVQASSASRSTSSRKSTGTEDLKDALANVRNAQRKADINSILNAVVQYKIDNGVFPPGISGFPTIICKNTFDALSGCVDLRFLEGSYMVTIPQDPEATEVAEWPGTGYAIYTNAKGQINVSAWHAELNETISVLWPKE